MELVDPRGREARAVHRLARRVRTAGEIRRIGFLSNEQEHLSGPHFPGYTRILEHALRERLGVSEFHREIKPVLSRPADSEMIARFSGYDGVINGLAK
ncbi:MAG: hypothetical protein JRG86_07550 [Deltaproteobacteria bacterium]|jgi:hypothetical protein|nr:hypothetical protein [Deltaproteobacteria bacterium]